MGPTDKEFLNPATQILAVLHTVLVQACAALKSAGFFGDRSIAFFLAGALFVVSSYLDIAQ